MTPERWQLTQDLLEEALALSEPERMIFLARSCEGDEPLREEIEELLAIDTRLGGFIEKPLFDVHGDHGSLAAGDELGSWRIVCEIGRGGMGAVYLAERADASFEKRAAIKLLKRGMDTDELVRRFRSERRILARLEHPHIARLLDGGSTPDGRPYLVMEYVEGRPIDAWCAEQTLSVEDRLVLFEKVCRAVHFAHRNLVVHRDLKPGNILVVADGEPRLLDFGIAKLLEEDSEPFATVAAFLPMTPEYASPEQIRGEPVTTATDIYSLGVLLYRLLAGRSPYRPAVEGRAALAEAVCNQEPLRPSTVVGARAKAAAESEAKEGAERDRHLAKRLRGDLDTIAQKALSKEPARRYESAEQLAADIRRHLDGLPVLARPSGVGYRTRKFVGRHKIGVSLAAAALMAILGAAAVALVQKARAEDAQVQEQWVSGFMTDVFKINDPSESQGREVKAIDLLEVARKKLEEQKVQPLQRARLFETLGTVYTSLGQYGTAKETFRRALDLYSSADLSDGPQRAAATLGLAEAQRAMGHFRDAERLMLDGLAELDRVGEKNADYVEALNNWGGLLGQVGRLDEAEKQFTRSLDLAQKLGLARTNGYAIALAGLGQVRLDQGHFADAESYYRRSLKLRQDLYGEPSIEVALTLNGLASVLEKTNRDQEAEGLYVQSLEMRKKVLGSLHPKLAVPFGNLALFYEERGQREKAEAPYREAVALCDKSGNEDQNCGTFLLNFTGFLVGQKRCHEAEPLGEKALFLLQTKGGNEENIAQVKATLASCHRERNDFKGAETLLLQARGPLPPGSDLEMQIRDRLVRLYEAWGKPDLAAKYRSEAAAKPTS